MAKKVIKYIELPSFPEADWQARNPLLGKGEMGHVTDSNGVILRSKVGPGRWNDLPWYADTLFDRDEVVTNPIGDAKGNLNGQFLMGIVEKMLFPYGVPVISALTNNAQLGSPQNLAIREIGLSLSGIVRLQYSLSNPSNLSGATPINVLAGGIFSNEGNHAHSGAIDMNLSAPLNPSVVTEYPINVKPLDLNGVGATVITKIKFVPRIIWGVSPLATLSGSQFNTIGQKKTALTDNFQRDYDFTAAGYCWLGIPVMLNPENLLFTDVTNANFPFGFAFDDMGVLSVNNGTGTYNYQMFRSTHYITESFSRVRVARQT